MAGYGVFVVVGLAFVSLAGCGSSAPSGIAASPSPSPSRAASAVRFDFDHVAESNGALRLEAVPESGAALESHVAAGGRLRSESHGSGRAVRFPAVCPTYGDPGCPRAILEAAGGAAVSPGGGDFRYGASVLVRPDETTEGANVLQKGYSVGHSQFKLQIDGKAGRPSCVLAGTDSSEIYVVTAPTTVANGQWHAIGCVRSGTDLSVSVDGVIVGQRNVPSDLSIVNSDPIRIGGKGTAPNNDQFHGAIDDAYVAIGP